SQPPIFHHISHGTAPLICCLGPNYPKVMSIPSVPEQAAMEEYIKEALQQGFIRPSTSPAASSFFFVSKKDGGLRPCIDYRALNSQTTNCQRIHQTRPEKRFTTSSEFVKEMNGRRPSLPHRLEGVQHPYVLTSLRLTLLDSVHTSPGSGHPSSQRTLSLLQNRYWWPSMAQDVACYIKGCSVCAMTTTPRRLPESKLVTLPLPRRPWSHLGVDFATDLPASQGYTTILVIVDRFSKACKLIPLKGLPTALETAEAHVF
ncbi:hypothetical protein M9458_046891, partial [Cirrhinus mrigala]